MEFGKKGDEKKMKNKRKSVIKLEQSCVTGIMRQVTFDYKEIKLDIHFKHHLVVTVWDLCFFVMQCKYFEWSDMANHILKVVFFY